MPKNVNKFKKLLEKYGGLYADFVECGDGCEYEELEEVEQELIKMYEDAIKDKEFYEKQYNDLYDRV